MVETQERFPVQEAFSIVSDSRDADVPYDHGQFASLGQSYIAPENLATPQLKAELNPDLVRLLLTVRGNRELSRGIAGLIVGQAVVNDIAEKPEHYAPDVTAAAFMNRWMQHQHMLHMMEMTKPKVDEEDDEEDDESAKAVVLFGKRRAKNTSEVKQKKRSAYTTAA
jgi:hypothetical protein